MTARRFTHLTVEQCAEMADMCVAASRPELISAFIRYGTHPEDARRLLAKPTAYTEPFNPGQHNAERSEEAVAGRFSFASLSGEAEIMR
jgi:hypothetical protein